ncbi:MAG: polysaccharide deacetylase family protein, partial [Thiohalomonadales bacterium]
MNISRRFIAAAVYPLAKIYQHLFPGIRILMYHRIANFTSYDQLVVTPARFEQQMSYLHKHYRVISLSQAIDELKKGNIQSGVVVTFDDGYLDNLQNALPILKKYNISATIFVTTTFCDQSTSHSRYSNDKQRV